MIRDICFYCDEPIEPRLPRKTPSGRPPYAHSHCFTRYMGVKPKLTLFLYVWELESMPETSFTMPSSGVIGRTWRANKNAFLPDEPPLWRVRMYIPDSHPDMVGNVSFHVVLRHGPAPRNYNPPDWACLRQREIALAQDFEKALM